MECHLSAYFPRSKMHMLISVIAIIALFGTGVSTGIFRAQTDHTAFATASDDWPTYAFNLRRVGINFAEHTINPTTAPNLKLIWTNKAGGAISAQPVEANSLIYWGSWDGLEHATNLSGTDIWTTNLGTTTSNCGGTVGVASTATINTLVLNGTSTAVDFVGGGNGIFYALNASTGAIIWQILLRSSPGNFLWSSPTLYNGNVYEGVASSGDCPTVQGKLVEMRAATGAIEHVFNVVPNGCRGGGVWGSPEVDPVSNTVFFATGNPSTCSTSEPYASALVQLRAADLTFISTWQVPSSQQIFDGDFGSTPTLFQATVNGTVNYYVGVGSKNGIFYAFNRSNIGTGPVWQDQVAVGGPNPEQGDGTISSAAWDGTTLYVAGGNTTINGSQCKGSLQAVIPATGVYLWQDCLANGPVLGAVSGVPGVIVVGAGNAMVVVNAKKGATLFSYQAGQGELFWNGASIANGMLYMTNSNHNLYAFGL